ncbi:unnamed protein product [Rangifer tarandus platyrhynchus]|uniref:Uncharacterized protein n=1 Tax=Rangifer tarandus platyrhynchus TaxID=3082113 RepID=A0AC59YZ40_RANTA
MGSQESDTTKRLHFTYISLSAVHSSNPVYRRRLCHVLSCVRLFAMLWTVACQAPLSMGFSRQKYWSGLPCPPPGGLPDSGLKPVSPVSPTLQVDSLPAESSRKPPRGAEAQLNIAWPISGRLQIQAQVVCSRVLALKLYALFPLNGCYSTLKLQE